MQSKPQQSTTQDETKLSQRYIEREIVISQIEHEQIIASIEGEYNAREIQLHKVIEGLREENERMKDLLNCLGSEVMNHLVVIANAKRDNIHLEFKQVLAIDQLPKNQTELRCHQLKVEVSSLEQKLHELNSEIATTKNANQRKDLVDQRNHSSKQLLRKVEELVELLSKSLHSVNNTSSKPSPVETSVHPEYTQLMKSQQSFIQSTQLYSRQLQKAELRVKQKLNDQTIEEQRNAIEILLGSYRGKRSKFMQFTQSAEKANELASKYNAIKSVKTDLEEQRSEIGTQIIKFNRLSSDEEIDDESREEAQKRKLELNKRQQQLILKIAEYTKGMKSIEKELIEYDSFGEVKRLLNTGKKEKVVLNDYKWMRNMGGRNNNVALYERNGEQCVLKKFMGVDHSMLRRERIVLSLPRHPLIVPINNVFTTDEAVYVETPFIEGGTLRDWIAFKTRSVNEIQSMLRMIAQSIRFLHSHDIIHCDLKPENILLRNSGGTSSIPMLCDFELSRNVENMSTNTTIGGSFKYMPPELVSGNGKLSSTGDIWAFGVIVYEMFIYPNRLPTSIQPDPQLLNMNNDKFIEEIRGNQDLFDLLLSVLCSDPSKRLDIFQIVNHKFFNASNSVQMRTKNSVDDFRAFLTSKKSSSSSDTSVEVNVASDMIVEGVLALFTTFNARDLKKPITVKFTGVDEVVLTSAFYSKFMNACVDSVLTTVASNGSTLYVPFDDQHTAVSTYQYESLGKILVKALFDQRTVPISLAPFVWRYLLAEDAATVEVTLRDLDMVDFEQANNLRMILSGVDVTRLLMDFSDIDPGNDTPVTNRNKHEFVKRSLKHKLINCREKNLEAFRQGFRSITDLVPFLNELSEVDAAVLINEQQFIEVETLISCLEFVGKSTEKFSEMMISVIRGMTQPEMSELLHLITGRVALFSSGIKTPLMNPNQHSPYSRDTITFNVYDHGENFEERLPVAHVCFYSVDVPLYSSEQVLKEKLLLASRDGKFTVA